MLSIEVNKERSDDKTTAAHVTINGTVGETLQELEILISHLAGSLLITGLPSRAIRDEITSRAKRGLLNAFIDYANKGGSPWTE